MQQDCMAGWRVMLRAEHIYYSSKAEGDAFSTFSLFNLLSKLNVGVTYASIRETTSEIYISIHYKYPEDATS